jgi:hypothetical protein
MYPGIRGVGEVSLERPYGDKDGETPASPSMTWLDLVTLLNLFGIEPTLSSDYNDEISSCFRNAIEMSTLLTVWACPETDVRLS